MKRNGQLWTLCYSFTMFEPFLFDNSSNERVLECSYKQSLIRTQSLSHIFKGTDPLVFGTLIYDLNFTAAL